MKLIIGEDITVFLIKPYIKKQEYKSEKNIKKLIKKINKKYETKLYGFINVTVYIDEKYGTIIKMKKEKNYFDCFNKEIDIIIKVVEKEFWYKTENYALKNKAKEIRKSGDSFYLKPKNVSDIELGQIIEKSEIIYEEVNWR